MSKTLTLLQQTVASSGMSVRAIAAQLGLNHSHLSRVLAGRVGIGSATLGRLMSVLDAKTGAALLETYLKEEREKVLSYHADSLKKKKPKPDR